MAMWFSAPSSVLPRFSKYCRAVGTFSNQVETSVWLCGSDLICPSDVKGSCSLLLPLFFPVFLNIAVPTEHFQIKQEEAYG